jgi:predicted nucleotidyltransferase
MMPEIERLILFGSRAAGDADPRADVDLALSAPRLTRPQFARLRVDAYEAPTLYWISLVHLEATPERLRERIEIQGIVIYERT